MTLNLKVHVLHENEIKNNIFIDFVWLFLSFLCNLGAVRAVLSDLFVAVLCRETPPRQHEKTTRLKRHELRPNYTEKTRTTQCRGK